MKKYYKYLILVVMAFNFGCAIRPIIHPPVRTINFPDNNKVATANIGDTIVKKAILYEVSGIKILSKAEGRKFGVNVIIYPGFKMLVGQTDSMKLYNLGPMDTQGGHPSLRYYVSVRKNNGTLGFIVSGAYGPGPFSKFDITPQYEHTTMIAQDSPSFIQELIYNGRSGNTLKFMYRELSGGYMRNAFTQESQYDLADGYIIGFKEVRIEVINASNTSITYKVIKGFN